MNRINVTKRTQLDELYKDWSLTFTGVAPTEENLGAVLEWVKSLTPLKREDVYVIEGSLMNREYGLTGDNAYPETDCNLVCVKLADMENSDAVVLPRFAVSGRWFTDIVDNNACNEAEQNGDED
jgi:hypothetical protein